MESATVGEREAQLVSAATISRSVAGFMVDDLSVERFAFSRDPPGEPQRERLERCRGCLKERGDGCQD